MNAINVEDLHRILFLAPQPFYEDRGTPIASLSVLKALSSLGYEVDLLTYPQGETIFLPGLKVFRIANLFRIRQVPIGFSGKKAILDIFMISRICKKLRETKYCCIHAVEEMVFPAIVLGKKHNIPVLYDMQSSLPEHMAKHWLWRGKRTQQFMRLFERWAIKNADFIACSTGLEQHVQKIDPGARIENWIFPPSQWDNAEVQPVDLRQTLGLDVESPIILYTGTFERYQGLGILLDSIETVLRWAPKAVFVFVGGGKLRCGHTRADIVRFQKSGALVTMPRQPRAQLPRLLASADVLVSPRDSSKNLPLKVFDYMMSGKPIVATDSSAHRHVLTEKRALLVNHTGADIGAGIVWLLQNPEIAEALGTAAKAYAEDHFDKRNFMRGVTRLYRSVCALTGSACHDSTL